MRLLFVLIAAIALSGCTLLSSDQVQRAGKLMQRGTDAWCENIPKEGRDQVREEFFPTPDGNTMTATCAKDSQ